MKLTMKFETADVEEMIEAYFAKSGFKVLNLETLCKSFASAYEKGINVEVSMESGSNGAGPSLSEEVYPGVTNKPEISAIDLAETKLTASQLADPDHHIPSIENILKKSEALQKDKDE